MDTIHILRDLIAFPTVSADPNRALIDYCVEILNGTGAAITLLEDETKKKANLYATIGPQEGSGVLLSGHSDVVPVKGQNWSVPAFEMSEMDGKLFGRGTADMKGFIASALNAARKAGAMDLKTPLHLAISYDEEIGCVGVRTLIRKLADAPFKPKFCIVGEPTSMALATGHKGKTACQVTCYGREAHSALAPSGLNAIYLACDLISKIRDLQHEIMRNGARDAKFDVDYTTLHVGRIIAGEALNIVPKEASFQFEIRNLFDDDPRAFLRRINKEADAILQPVLPDFPDAKIEISILNEYPPLETPEDSQVVRFVRSLKPEIARIKVAFGTEGGLFSSVLDIPTIVCGPGSMEQGHKPDEFITKDQLARCDTMMEALLDRLAAEAL